MTTTTKTTKNKEYNIFTVTQIDLYLQLGIVAMPEIALKLKGNQRNC